MDVRVSISLEINAYPRRIRCISNSGYIFREKSASYRSGNTVLNSTVATVACIVIGASDVAWVTDACCCWVQSNVCYENINLIYIQNVLEAKFILQLM
jgi:hypothetical protein